MCSTEMEVISERFINDIRQFQCLLNTLYERSVRECFERSINKLTGCIKQICEFMSESVSKGADLHILE
jgi:hypothetical protein